MAFAETRLKQPQNTVSIQDAFSEFQILFQNQSNDFLSLAICANSNHGVLVSCESFFPEVNGLLVDVNKDQLRLNILLLYRPKDMHPLLFCNSLENIVSTHEIEIIYIFQISPQVPG